MYDELFKIKVHREQTAAQALRRQQYLVEQQTQVVQQARDETARFHENRVRREQQLFAEIKGQRVALRAIETMNQHVAVLREREALLEARIVEEEKRLQDEQNVLEDARRQHIAAVRAREKFDQFVEAQRVVEHRERMMREEAELEEIASAGHQARQEI